MHYPVLVKPGKPLSSLQASMPMKKRVLAPAKAAAKRGRPARAGRKKATGTAATGRDRATIRKLRGELKAALKRIEELQAFAGTDFKSVADWRANVGQGLGLQTAQYRQAEVLAQDAREAFGNNLAITGHSLGGGLASAASLATGTPAVKIGRAHV